MTTTFRNFFAVLRLWVPSLVLVVVLVVVMVKAGVEVKVKVKECKSLMDCRICLDPQPVGQALAKTHSHSTSGPGQ